MCPMPPKPSSRSALPARPLPLFDLREFLDSAGIRRKIT
jgi:hypothetical protein